MKKPKRKRKFLLLVCLALLVLSGGVISTLRSTGPTYKGRSIDEWLASYNSPHSLNWPRLENPADTAIQALGTNCFPAIIDRLRKRDSKARRQLANIARKLRLPIQIPTHERAHREALGALGALRTTAVPLVPKLAEAVESMDVSQRVYAGFWLESLGADADEAVPTYLRILNDHSNQLPRHWAVQTLSAIGARQRERVLPVLISCLNDSNQFVRLQATNELTREPWTTPKVELVQPDLARWNLEQLLTGRDSERVGAIYYFGHEPKLAPEVVPLLISQLHWTNIQVLEASAKALAAYGETAQASLASLTNLLSHPRKYVRVAASNAVERIGRKMD